MAIIHLHIPKCAGRSVLTALRRQYGGGVLAIPALGWRNITPARARSATAISGHFPVSAIDDWGLQGYMFTFLREPLKRIGSLYVYIMERGPRHAAYAQVAAMSPQEFAERGPFDNCMTRMLAGMREFQWADRKAPLTDELFQRAVDNLSAFDMVGDVASFADDMHYLAAELGWERFKVPHANSTTSPPRVLPTVAVCRKWAWDLALYQIYLSGTWL